MGRLYHSPVSTMTALDEELSHLTRAPPCTLPAQPIAGPRNDFGLQKERAANLVALRTGLLLSHRPCSFCIARAISGS